MNAHGAALRESGVIHFKERGKNLMWPSLLHLHFLCVRDSEIVAFGKKRLRENADLKW